MKLGENIYCLRTEKRLSQEELANLLGVSRQSVSKWENDAAVPELEKLVQMAEIFEVSLDSLVKGQDRSEDEKDKADFDALPSSKTNSGTRKIIGVILLCFGFLVALLLLLMGGGLFSFFYAIPFLSTGIICLSVRRRTGLWCVWAIWISIELYLRYATGLTWQNILLTHLWEPHMNYVRLAISWVMAVIPIILIACTSYSFRKADCFFGGKLSAYLGGWLVALLIKFAYPAIIGAVFGYLVAPGQIFSRGMSMALLWLRLLGDLATAAALCVMIVWTVSLIRTRRKDKTQN